MLTPQDISYIIFEPTTYCNAFCPQCGRFDGNGNLDENLTLDHLTLDAVKNIPLHDMPRLENINFEGDKGDPLMNPYIMDLINYFSGIKYVRVVTNGGIRDEQWWRELAKVKNLTVVWSIDGLADTNHLYRVGVKFEKVMKNASAFISAGGKAVWKFLTFEHNQHQIQEVTALSNSMGFSGIHILSSDISRFNGKTSSPVYTYGKLSHYIKPTTLSVQTSMPQPVNRFGKIKDLKCPWLRNRTLYVNFKGYVLPCCMMHFETDNEYHGKYNFLKMTNGNFDNISLYHNTLDKILNSKLYNNELETTLATGNMHTVCRKSCGHLI